MSEKKEVRIAKWYFGGMASAGAACLTHPLDLLKVQMQTQKGKNVSIFQLTKKILSNDGIFGLYNGISASLTRQMTYSTARFGMYEVGKQALTSPQNKTLSIYQSAALAGVSGLTGGIVGSPADLVNVRMQNDMKLPPDKRRNYKNVIDGFYQVISKEGVTRLWTGGSTNCLRAVLMTIGQLTFYDQAKQILLATPYFHDNVATHMTSSIIAGAIATTMCQPVDVLKTRAMNAKPGEDRSVMALVRGVLKEGPQAFLKGYGPAFVRLAPQTILTFVFLEQIRLNFGTIVKS